MNETYQRCTAWAEPDTGRVWCDLPAGHPGAHDASGYVWDTRYTAPVQQLQSKSLEERLRGRTYDSMFRELFARMESLEQTSAGGAATDDMFATTRRGMVDLDQRLARLERGLDPAGLTVGPETWRLDLMAQLRVITDKLERIAVAVEPKLVPICEEPDTVGVLHCEREPGHDGRHESGIISWPVKHPANPDAAERASGSPVRCSTRFREGQCLGYAGHDGECSAVPSDNPQLEDPDEFAGDPFQAQVPPTCSVAHRYAEAGLGEVQECFLAEGHEGMHEDGTGRKFKA